MNVRYHGTILACLAGVTLLGGLGGGMVGHRLGRQAMQARSDPESWHTRASRHFEQAVHPTPEQSEKLERHLGEALAELKAIRLEALNRSTEVIDRLAARVEAELTPEQKAAFERIKPRREDLMPDVMKIERGELGGKSVEPGR